MNDSIKSSTSTLEKGDTTPHVSDNSQLSDIKPFSYTELADSHLAADLQAFQSKADELADMIFSYALMIDSDNNPDPSQIASHLDSELKTLKKTLRKIEAKRLNGRAK